MLLLTDTVVAAVDLSVAAQRKIAVEGEEQTQTNSNQYGALWYTYCIM